MGKYRKKPVVVEAVQWPCYHPAVVHCDCSAKPGTGCANCGHPFIQTLEGPMRVSVGDWIITGVNGEHYPCKPEIFAKTYEAVEVDTFETRLRREQQELNARVTSLRAFANKGYPHANEHQRDLLEQQLMYMTNYLEVLEERLHDLGA